MRNCEPELGNRKLIASDLFIASRTGNKPISFQNGEFSTVFCAAAACHPVHRRNGCGKPQTERIDYRCKPRVTESICMTAISPQLEKLHLAIQFASQSHQVTAQNLANVNTKDYKARELSFDRFLEQLDSGSQMPETLELQLTQGLQERADGNNVDMDRELAQLKKNTLVYQTLTQLLGSKMSILKRAISS